MKEAGEVQAAAGALGLEVIMLEIRQAHDIGLVFEAHKGQADALYVQGDLLTTANRIAIDTEALGARLPSTYAFREDVESGGPRLRRTMTDARFNRSAYRSAALPPSSATTCSILSRAFVRSPALAGESGSPSMATPTRSTMASYCEVRLSAKRT
jgi:hypothetical protein